MIGLWGWGGRGSILIAPSYYSIYLIQNPLPYPEFSDYRQGYHQCSTTTHTTVLASHTIAFPDPLPRLPIFYSITNHESGTGINVKSLKSPVSAASTVYSTPFPPFSPEENPAVYLAEAVYITVRSYFRQYIC